MQAHWRGLRKTAMAIAIGIALVGVATAVVPGATSRAHAQAQGSIGSPVGADYKGAVGLGLVGAELGAVIPALAGMDETWAFIVFPVVGAAGGALAGYFAIDNPGHADISVVALTAGMALVIPALVTTLALTAYDPESEQQDGAATRTQRRHTARLKLLRSARFAGSGLLRVSEGQLALAAPGIALLPTATRGELQLSGVNVALFSGRF
jgi:hypothetical protein